MHMNMYIYMHIEKHVNYTLIYSCGKASKPAMVTIIKTDQQTGDGHHHPKEMSKKKTTFSAGKNLPYWLVIYCSY